jgi:hypothetical protein
MVLSESSEGYYDNSRSTTRSEGRAVGDLKSSREESEALRIDTADRVVYECPHCREELEASPGPWNGWRLCPRCGRAGLPPGLDAKRIRRAPLTTRSHGVFVTHPTANREPAHAIQSLVALSVLTLAVLFALTAYQGQFQLDVAILGLAALLLFGLLIYVGGRRKTKRK